MQEHNEHCSGITLHLINCRIIIIIIIIIVVVVVVVVVVKYFMHEVICDVVNHNA